MTHSLRPYESISSENYFVDTRAKIWMEDKAVKDAYNYLIAHNCTVCHEDGKQQAFKSFRALKDHIRKDHQLFLCDICVEHIKVRSVKLYKP